MLERNKKIIMLRSSGMTLQSLGEMFGVSRERVRQITTPGWRPPPQKSRARVGPRFRENSERYDKALELARESNMSSREIADRLGLLEFTVCRWLGRNYAGYAKEEHQDLTPEYVAPVHTLSRSIPAPLRNWEPYSVRMTKQPRSPCVVCGDKVTIRVALPGQLFQPVCDRCRLKYERGVNEIRRT